MEKLSGEMVVMSRSLRKMTLRVWGRRAAASEARKCWGWPRPRTSGLPRRVPTMMSGRSLWMTARAKVPLTEARADLRLSVRRSGPEAEGVAWGEELGFGIGVVFDGAVVDEGEETGLVEVGVGVGV